MSSMQGSAPYRGATGANKSLQGTGYRQISSPQFTKEQMNLFKQLFSQTGQNSPLGRLAGGDQESFSEIEAPAMRQFNELLGGLGSRFSGMGSTGARKSSGFQNAATSAASNFAQDLQASRLGIQRQAQQDLFALSQGLLGQRPFEDIFIQKMQKQPGFWKSLFTGLAGGVGQTATDLGGRYLQKRLNLF
jgi:hypothetical protein